MKKIFTLAILTFSVMVFSQVPSYVPTNGLLRFWSFTGNYNDDVSGSNLLTSGYSTNLPTPYYDRFGNANNAYKFDASYYFKALSGSGSGDFSTSSFTVSIWYKITGSSSTNYPFIDYLNSNHSLGWGIGLYNNNSTTNPYKITGLELGNNIQYSAQNTQTDAQGIWKLATFVRDVSSMKDKLYLDGMLVAQTNLITVVDHNSVNGNILEIGNYNYGYYDEIGLWNRALTDSEINSLFNNFQRSPPPIASSTQTFCVGTYPKESDVIATGANLKWYTVSDGGVPHPMGSAQIFDNTTYYVSQTISGFGESIRVPVSVIINHRTIPSFTAIAPVCSGTIASPLPTSSTNGITGSWSPTWNNLVTTTYTFTPTAGQCAYGTTMAISITPPSITPTFSSVAPVCSGAIISPLPTTSNNAITGTWYPALNNTASTTYTFTPTGGQCAKTITKVITINPYITPTFSAIAPLCSGSTIAPLPTSSTNGIAGSWAPALNNLATTTYTFTPTPVTGQCLNTNTLTITINSVSTPMGSSNQNLLPGTTIAYIVVNPATNIFWYPTYASAVSDVNPLLPSTVLINGATYYAVQVIAGCRSDVFAVTVNLALGVDENTRKDFAIYPNPAQDKFTIDFGNELNSNYSIKIDNILGQEVYSNVINKPQFEVCKTWQGEGLYFVTIYDLHNNLIATKKIILQ